MPGIPTGRRRRSRALFTTSGCAWGATGADYLVESSADGSHWTQLRLAHLIEDDGRRAVAAGLYACSPKAAGYRADFEFLEITDRGGPGRIALFVVGRSVVIVVVVVGHAIMGHGRHRYVETRIAVEKPDRLQMETDRPNRHHRPILRPDDVVRAEGVPHDHVGV